MIEIAVASSDKIYTSQVRFLNENLNKKQVDFIKQYVWTVRFSFRVDKTLLTIRSTDFTSREWTMIYLLFPDARLL